jgi:hypothetical protein
MMAVLTRPLPRPARAIGAGLMNFLLGAGWMLAITWSRPSATGAILTCVVGVASLLFWAFGVEHVFARLGITSSWRVIALQLASCLLVCLPVVLAVMFRLKVTWQHPALDALNILFFNALTRTAGHTMRRERAEAKARGPGLHCPPGFKLREALRFVFSRRTMEYVFDPALADMQAEWVEAMLADRPGHATWICLRGYWHLMKHLLAQLPAGSWSLTCSPVKTHRRPSRRNGSSEALQAAD